ncbi:MAG: hypothetical protein IJ560_02985 [Alphaproteobacteria bacterium]|nr:hypothetical protein [Alphaproteobacteria bacterium]
MFALILSACGASFEMRMDVARHATLTGDFATANEFAANSDVSNMNDLELLVTGGALFNMGNYSASDAAFEEFNHRNINMTGFSVSREMATVSGGAMAAQYRPYMMDSLFVSYYQILSALAENRWSDARVIINQSYARQQKMSREYKQLLANRKNDTATAAQLAENIRNENSQWAAYADIMNPALTYLAGIYFLADHDWANAETYLGRADGMTQNTQCIATDLSMARAKTAPHDNTWVFIETGIAPRLTERRITIPWIVGNGMSMISIATATPKFTNDTTRISGGELIADIDKMFMTEFNEYSVNNAIRAAIGAAARAVLQSVAYNGNSRYSPLFGLGATIFSVATTSADVRSWATLPEYIYVMRTDTPKSGLLEIKANGNVIANVPMPNAGNHIVYIRVGVNTTAHVMDLR